MNVKDTYESEWKQRLTREPAEDFYRYERNWLLPQLFIKNENILDLASGNSIVGEYLIKNFKCHVIAMDLSAAALSDAKRRGLETKKGDIEKILSFKSNTFDMVFWGDNIEHVYYPEKILSEIYRVLKHNGRIILSTPNQAYWRHRVYTFVTGKLPKTEGEDNKPWAWTHIRFFTRSILKELLIKTGFKETQFLTVSRRRPDRPFLKIFPELFGMVIVIEAKKTEFLKGLKKV
jgi:methionine biosynthesis protein MetW